jgi:DUF438 domain-containing protein
VLARTTTLYVLLEEYPFLEDYLVAFHQTFQRLEQPEQGRTWARMVTLGELATAMNLPWLELLREIQGEVRRVVGVAPAIVGDTAGVAADARFGGDLRAIVREMEGGAPLDELAQRLDGLTRGLDAEGVAVLARELDLTSAVSAEAMVRAAGQPMEGPAARVSLHPGHPVRSLQREGERLAGLAGHVEELVDGLGSPPEVVRWREVRSALESLLARLGELERQARRLRLAWYATLASRGSRSVTGLVDGELGEAIDAIRRLRAAAARDDANFVAANARQAVERVRRTLAAEEELLIPAALRSLDDDDWEAVAEQERVVGWALAPDQAL